MGRLVKEFIEFIAKQLVDKPDKVSVEETTPDEHTIELNLKVDNSDIGKVIGKHGNTVNAMRTLLIAVGAKGGHRATLQIVEEFNKTGNK
jgi:predicted RNA-binding protein YlqC (UPF0109 family)